MFIYIFIVLALTGYALLYDRLDERSKSISTWGWIIFLLLFAAFRGAEVDNDTEIYARNVRQSLPLSQFFTNCKYYIQHSPPPELSFCVLTSALKGLFSHPLRILLFIYAFLAIPKKVLVLKDLSVSGSFGFVLLAYFTNYYLLHDMTQIRVGLAIVFFFLALPYAYERKFVQFCLLITAGALIHRSVFMIILVYFLNPKEINFKLWMSVLFSFLFLALIHFDLVSIMQKVHIPVFSEKLDTYLKMQSWIDVKGNPFNTFLMLQLFTCILAYYYRDILEPKCKYFYLLLKVNLVSIIVFYVFIGLVGFSFRLNEMFGVVQILMLPMLVYIFKQRWAGQALVIGITLCMLLFNLFHTGLLRPYYLCFFD